MTIKHRCGKANGNGNGTAMLERMPVSCQVVEISTVRKPMKNGLGLKRTSTLLSNQLSVRSDSKSDTANEGCNWPGSLSYKDLRKAQENVLNSSWINDTSKSRLLTVPKGTWRNSAPRLIDLFYKLLLDFSKRRTTPLRPCAYGQIDQYTRTILQAIRYYLLKMCVSSSIGIDIYNLFLVQYTSITSIEQKNWIYS